MRAIGIGLVILVGLVGVDVSRAAACSCVVAATPCGAYASEPVVFVGDVVAVQEMGTDVQMRLHVVRSLKGIREATAELWSELGTSCGVKLTVGDRYVVHTSRGDNGRMFIHACSYTRRLTAGEPIPELPPLPGRIYGDVVRYDREPIRRFLDLDPVAAVRVWLDLPSGRVSATSDAWGRFTLEEVPPGTYEIGVDAGQGLTPWIGTRVTLATPGDCARAHVVLRPSGTLSGRVLTADRKPASGVYVLLLAADMGDEEPSSVVTGRNTDKEGWFRFDGLASGEYKLAVNPDDRPRGHQPFPATFFGGKTRATATRIGVGLGSPTELDAPFVLRAALPTRELLIAVSCRDGSVPRAVSVTASPIERDLAVESHWSFDGPATLAILGDVSYRVEVEVWVGLRGPSASTDTRSGAEKLPAFEVATGLARSTVQLVAPFDDCAARR